MRLGSLGLKSGVHLCKSATVGGSWCCGKHPLPLLVPLSLGEENLADRVIPRESSSALQTLTFPAAVRASIPAVVSRTFEFLQKGFLVGGL